MSAAHACAATPLRFSKMQGAGNDFVILDWRGAAMPLSAAQARRLCDRHYGIGCDQLLTIETSNKPDCIAAYRIYNADGSTAEQCGNGARCIAAWLARDGAFSNDSAWLQSPAGPVRIERLPSGQFQVTLTTPVFEPDAIPLALPGPRDEYALTLGNESVCFGAVSMGNPHAVVIVDDVAAAPVARLGTALQAQPVFPQSCNVGFVQTLARDRIRLRVYERGAGETLACGSGACAAVAVLRRRDRVNGDVAVELPGGELRVFWPGMNAPIALSGPAEFVFEGEWHE